MSRPNRYEKHWPGLKEYWTAYGHSVPWDDLIDFKERSDGFYIVLIWDRGDGMLGLADVAGHRDGGAYHWEMQNDSEDVTPAQWKGLRIVPECDWYTVPEE